MSTLLILRKEILIIISSLTLINKKLFLKNLSLLSLSNTKKIETTIVYIGIITIIFIIIILNVAQIFLIFIFIFFCNLSDIDSNS